MRTRAPGVAANCASALAQMAAASCVQEEREEKEVGETGDAITQGSADTHTVSTHTHTCFTKLKSDLEYFFYLISYELIYQCQHVKLNVFSPVLSMLTQRPLYTGSIKDI